MPANPSTRPKADLASGVFFIVFGVATILWSRSFEFGTAMRIGPGVFPSIAGALSVLVGGILAVKSGAALTKSGNRHPSENPFSGALRPLVCVVGALVFFAVSIEAAGLVVAVFGAALISSLGGKQFRVRETVALAIGLSVGAVVIFVMGLGLPVPVLPR